MRRLTTLLVDVLIAAAILIGVIWLLTWVQLSPNVSTLEFPPPTGLPGEARRSAILVLVPAVAAMAVWLSGHRWGRYVVILSGGTVLFTASGWERIPDAEILQQVSWGLGALLILSAVLPGSWAVPPERGLNLPRILRLVVALVLVPVLVVAAQTAWFGWDLGLHVSANDSAENGWQYLVPALTVMMVCTLACWQLLSRTPIEVRAERYAANAPGRRL